MNFKSLQTLTFLLLVLLSVSGCGRKNAPEQLEPNGYPHQYPPVYEEVIN